MKFLLMLYLKFLFHYSFNLQITFHTFGKYTLGSESETEFHTHDYICQNDWFIFLYLRFVKSRLNCKWVLQEWELLYNSIVLHFLFLVAGRESLVI